MFSRFFETPSPYLNFSKHASVKYKYLCHQNFAGGGKGIEPVFVSLNPKLGSFPVPPFKIPSFMFVLRVITAKCVMLRCKVWRTNLFTVVDLFTTPNFIALWQRWKDFSKLNLKGRHWKRAQNCKTTRHHFLVNWALKFLVLV